MTDAELAQGRVPLRTAPAATRRVVRFRHRDRDFALRRALLVADWAGLWLALIAALAIASNQRSPLAQSLWLLPTLPTWAVLFRTYGLYQRPVRRVEPTHLDDMSALLHALMIGTLGLWLFYKFGPAHQLAFEEIVIFGCVSLPLIAGLASWCERSTWGSRAPSGFLSWPRSRTSSCCARKLRNHPEYEMSLVGTTDCDPEAAGCASRSASSARTLTP